MNLIFDFDGTICDSFDASLLVLNEYLLSHSLPKVTKSEMRDGGFKALVRKRHIPLLFIPRLVLSGQKEIKKYIPKLKTYPKMEEVLLKLSKHNFMAIITSNSRENVEIFLKNNHILNVFQEVSTDFSMFGKEKKLKNIMKKYKLRTEETFYIGDETRDVEAAKKARVKSVAVGWGFESRMSLIKSEPDFLLDNPGDLLELV